MKTPTELIGDLRRTLEPMENDSLAIFEYASLLCVLTAGPDAETAMDGIHRLMLGIRDHADALRTKQDEAWRSQNGSTIRNATIGDDYPLSSPLRSILDRFRPRSISSPYPESMDSRMGRGSGLVYYPAISIYYWH